MSILIPVPAYFAIFNFEEDEERGSQHDSHGLLAREKPHERGSRSVCKRFRQWMQNRVAIPECRCVRVISPPKAHQISARFNSIFVQRYQLECQIWFIRPTWLTTLTLVIFRLQRFINNKGCCLNLACCCGKEQENHHMLCTRILFPCGCLYSSWSAHLVSNHACYSNGSRERATLWLEVGSPTRPMHWYQSNELDNQGRGFPSPLLPTFGFQTQLPQNGTLYSLERGLDSRLSPRFTNIPSMGLPTQYFRRAQTERPSEEDGFSFADVRITDSLDF